MSDTTIIEGPDGRLYEIPKDQLAQFEVPGKRVAELRRKMAEKQSANGSNGTGSNGSGAKPQGHATVPQGHATMPQGHAPGPQGHAMPPGHAPMPPGHAPMPQASMSFSPAGGVVLNFYFQAPPPGPPGAIDGALTGHGEAGVEGYHMSFDEIGIPTNHTEMLWGDYVDKQGNPAVGWHNHDPVTGNAQ